MLIYLGLFFCIFIDSEKEVVFSFLIILLLSKNFEEENNENFVGEVGEEEDINEGEWDIEVECDRLKLDVIEGVLKSGFFCVLKKEGNF